jgi:hypothetical protein
MEIHEIKWVVGGLASDVEVFGGSIFGGIIACKLDLGTTKITNGFVPIWNFGRADDLSKELHVSTNLGVPYEVASFFHWRLPRPLYVPEGGILTPTFQHRGLLSQSLSVQISYSARSLDVKSQPKKLYVPYVASYTSRVLDFTAGQPVETDESTETDLVNPWSEPLFLQRFTGRFYTKQDFSGVINVAEDVFPTLSNDGTRIRIVDSGGRPIVQNPTPFRQVFSAPTRSWEMEGHVMDPHSHYRVFVRKTQPSFPVFGTVQGQAHVGVVGFREWTGGGR